MPIDDYPSNTIGFVVGAGFSSGLGKILQLDPDRVYNLIVLSRVDLGNTPEKKLTPAQIIEYLTDLGNRRDTVGYVELPEEHDPGVKTHDDLPHVKTTDELMGETYVVSDLEDMKSYIEAMALVANQLGKDFEHVYDAASGTMRFPSRVEIDTYPLNEAGFKVNRLPTFQ